MTRKPLQNCHLLKLMAISNSSSASLKQPAILKPKMQWNRFRTTWGGGGGGGGSAHHTRFKAFTGVSPPILIDALVELRILKLQGKLQGSCGAIYYLNLEFLANAVIWNYDLGKGHNSIYKHIYNWLQTRLKPISPIMFHAKTSWRCRWSW
jgi:hypothetical protein